MAAMKIFLCYAVPKGGAQTPARRPSPSAPSGIRPHGQRDGADRPHARLRPQPQRAASRPQQTRRRPGPPLTGGPCGANPRQTAALKIFLCRAVPKCGSQTRRADPLHRPHRAFALMANETELIGHMRAFVRSLNGPAPRPKACGRPARKLRTRKSDYGDHSRERCLV
jgi:hypothetical protein